MKPTLNETKLIATQTKMAFAIRNALGTFTDNETKKNLDSSEEYDRNKSVVVNITIIGIILIIVLIFAFIFFIVRRRTMVKKSRPTSASLQGKPNDLCDLNAHARR